MGQTFTLSENLHLKKPVTIEKMTQKYALSFYLEAERQIFKCEFNLKDGEVNVYYKVTAISTIDKTLVTQT
jgi:hypothetical protein